MKRWSNNYKITFYIVHKSSMSMKLTSNNVFWQSNVHLHSHRDCVMFVPISLPTFAILALYRLTVKKEDDEHFARAAKTLLDIWCFTSTFSHLKVSTNAGTTVKNAYILQLN